MTSTKIRMMFAIAGTLSLGGIGTVAAIIEPSSQDRDAITAIVTPWLRPAERFQTVDWENAFGGRKQGFRELDAFLDARVRPTMANVKIDVREMRMTMVTPDVAIADKYHTLSGQTDGPGGAFLPDRNVRQTYVLRKSDGNWNVVAERIADLRS